MFIRVIYQSGLRDFWAAFAVYPAELYELTLQDVQLAALIQCLFRIDAVPDQADTQSPLRAGRGAKAGKLTSPAVGGIYLSVFAGTAVTDYKVIRDRQCACRTEATG